MRRLLSGGSNGRVSLYDLYPDDTALSLQEETGSKLVNECARIDRFL